MRTLQESEEQWKARGRGAANGSAQYTVAGRMAKRGEVSLFLFLLFFFLSLSLVLSFFPSLRPVWDCPIAGLVSPVSDIHETHPSHTKRPSTGATATACPCEGKNNPSTKEKRCLCLVCDCRSSSLTSGSPLNRDLQSPWDGGGRGHKAGQTGFHCGQVE